MKRKFYEYDTNDFIDLSLVAYIKVKNYEYQLDIFRVVAQDKNYEELWNEKFKTREDAKAHANRLVALMEQQENEN